MKDLKYKKKNIWKNVSKEELEKIKLFNEDYKKFLNNKTEREVVEAIVKRAKEKGFVDIESEVKDEKQFKYYRVYKNKCVALSCIGKQFNVKEGFNITGAHLDSPRLDLKPNCVYEDSGFCMFKSHYYGGIRKYQWVSLPLSLHGKVILKEGKEIDVVVGEKENDPVFVIADLLPHLAKNHRDRKLPRSHDAEKLNIIVGNSSMKIDEKAVGVKDSILQMLNDQYGIIEEDLLHADLSIVPALKPRDVGFDRSMIGAYGHDDRSCSFSSLIALLDFDEQPEKTCMSFFFDREEIGNWGNTGAWSAFFEDFCGDVLEKQTGSCQERVLRKVLMASKCLSADVNAAINPNFKEVHEKKNACEFGFGPCLSKYTGARGKSGTSEASAEFLNSLRMIFNEHNVIYQFAGMGKIDLGGGGTIAKVIATRGMDIVDLGVGLLGMHSPYEVASKADMYMLYKAVGVFFKFLK